MCVLGTESLSPKYKALFSLHSQMEEPPRSCHSHSASLDVKDSLHFLTVQFCQEPYYYQEVWRSEIFPYLQANRLD